ncbi:MAG: hypothetical protein ACI9G5_001762 [Paracoccaceae bacterium]|jgi:hypothetical protein
MGLDIPVFWSVREDDLQNTNFGTRQYNHVVLKDEADLAEKLFYRITAVLQFRNTTE